MKKSKKDLIFYLCLLFVPLAQFIVFYIVVNINSFLLSFQNIDILHNTKTFTTDNIVKAFNDLTSDTLGGFVKNSLIAFLLTFGISTPLALLFSYFIYKKLPFGGFFRVALFIPSIVSSIVLVTIFQFYVNRAMPAIFGENVKPLINPETKFGTIIVYNIFAGFGTTVLLYTNAMSGISEELIEAAKIDGATPLKEFFYVVIPQIFPTIVTFTITSVGGIFAAQLALYSFYGAGASPIVQTIGYYLYKGSVGATSDAEYPILAATGLLLTCVAIPLTFGIKYLLEKFGPSEK